MIAGGKGCSPIAKGVTDVIYKGIRYTIAVTDEPDIWRWRFEIGNSVRSGRTQTRLVELATRRVQSNEQKRQTLLKLLADKEAKDAQPARKERD